MDFGLEPEYVHLLKGIFKKHALSGQVIVYGSRAKGTFTERSDLDIAIKGSNADRNKIEEIRDEIDESDFPYLVDVQLYENIQNSALIEHIDRVGRVLYSSDSTYVM